MLTTRIKKWIAEGSVSLSTTPVLVPALSSGQRVPYEYLDFFGNTAIIYVKETMNKSTAPTITSSDYHYAIPVFGGTPYIVADQNDDIAIWMALGSGTGTVKWRAK